MTITCSAHTVEVFMGEEALDVTELLTTQTQAMWAFCLFAFFGIVSVDADFPSTVSEKYCSLLLGDK